MLTRALVLALTLLPINGGDNTVLIFAGRCTSREVVVRDSADSTYRFHEVECRTARMK